MDCSKISAYWARVLAFEINSGEGGYVNEISATITRLALQQGIYLRPLGNTVYIMPPYCIRPEQLRKVYDFILSIPFGLKREA